MEGSGLTWEKAKVAHNCFKGKNQMCGIWTGCLTSSVKTPRTTSGFIACSYPSLCDLARLAPQSYSWTGGPGMEGMKPVYRTCLWGCGLLNLPSVGDLSVTSSFPRRLLDRSLTNAHSFHIYWAPIMKLALCRVLESQ